jgi:hypothetical protein
LIRAFFSSLGMNKAICKIQSEVLPCCIIFAFQLAILYLYTID